MILNEFPRHFRCPSPFAMVSVREESDDALEADSSASLRSSGTEEEMDRNGVAVLLPLPDVVSSFETTEPVLYPLYPSNKPASLSTLDKDATVPNDNSTRTPTTPQPTSSSSDKPSGILLSAAPLTTTSSSHPVKMLRSQPATCGETDGVFLSFFPAVKSFTPCPVPSSLARDVVVVSNPKTVESVPPMKTVAVSAEIPKSLKGIERPLETDILFGRGEASKRHKGNLEYRKLVIQNKALYQQAPPTEKSLVSQRIVHQIYQQGRRFLKKDETDGLWYPVDDKAARAKVAQALRTDNARRKKPTK